jgi:hypothetical protein
MAFDPLIALGGRLVAMATLAAHALSTEAHGQRQTWVHDRSPGAGHPK